MRRIETPITYGIQPKIACIRRTVGALPLQYGIRKVQGVGQNMHIGSRHGSHFKPSIQITHHESAIEHCSPLHLIGCS